jgi:predicted nucleic acid-binding Zn ribbon protein
VDRRVLDGLPPLEVLNPLRSEQEAFRFLVYVIVVVAIVVAVVLAVRALA